MAKNALRFLDPSDSSVNCTCNILDKDLGTFQYVQYMFDRTNQMFRYKGLPDTIPEYMMEYMLQVYGSIAIIENKGDIYAMRAQFGGPPDPYYRPTQAVCASPALGIGKSFAIFNYLPPYDRVQWDKMDKCVAFLNDSQMMGLLPLFSRYAVQMVENDISIRSAQINLRQQTVIAADSGTDAESAAAYMSSLEAGKLATITKKAFTDGVQVMNGSSNQTNTVMQLIELQQYLKASWYNEIGLNSNFNMKRQYVSSEEINSTADIMLPLIDNMFEARQIGVENMNKLFGLSVSVEKDSAWEKKQIQSDMSVTPEGGEPIEPMEPIESQNPSSVNKNKDGEKDGE